jgi:hypothetical protein
VEHRLHRALAQQHLAAPGLQRAAVETRVGGEHPHKPVRHPFHGPLDEAGSEVLTAVGVVALDVNLARGRRLAEGRVHHDDVVGGAQGVEVAQGANAVLGEEALGRPLEALGPRPVGAEVVENALFHVAPEGVGARVAEVEPGLLGLHLAGHQGQLLPQALLLGELPLGLDDLREGLVDAQEAAEVARAGEHFAHPVEQARGGGRAHREALPEVAVVAVVAGQGLGADDAAALDGRGLCARVVGQRLAGAQPE